MRTAFLTASVSRAGGGVSEICRRLAQSLVATNRVDVDVMGLKDPATDQDLSQWDSLLPRAFPINGPASYGFAPQLASALNQADPHVAHVHGLWMYPSLAAARWAKKARKPFLITIHGMLEPWALRNSRWKKKLAAWFVEDAVLHSAACLQVNTEHELRSVRDYGLRNPVCILPNGVDLTGDLSAIPAPWEADGGTKTLLYLGRLHPKKNLPNLLKAWASLGAAKPTHWKLKIAGWDQNNHESELRLLSKVLGLEATVEFIGPLFGERKTAALANADAFILPSFSEGLPMAVLEAWAHRLPVLMTPECNLPRALK